MADIIDISRNRETGEIEQFTIIDNGGQPQLVKATPENMLLYDPADDLPFENGMHDFLAGEQALVLSEDPEVIVAPTDNEYCFILRVRGDTVETTPNQAEQVLRGVKDAAIDGNVDSIVDVFDEIMSTQVRRPVINSLLDTFSQADRINVHPRGWLVDGFYLVNWQASMYMKHTDPDEGDYKRGGGGVRKTDTSYEFVQLDLRRDVEPVTVQIGGEKYRLTEREMLFLAKVKWLLGRRNYHPDRPFWMFVDKRAAVDAETGEPIEEADDDDSPDMDTFEL